MTARSFCTIEVDVSEKSDPQAEILKAIARRKIAEGVVRLIYKIRSEQLELINTAALHEALSVAHTYTIQPELVSQLARPRLPEFGAGKNLTPMEALTTYLSSRDNVQDILNEMLEAAQTLLQNES